MEANVRAARLDPGVLNADERRLRIRYTNWRGESAVRRILPSELFFGSSEWHPTPQWLLRAFDFDRNAERSFALVEIVEWLPWSDDEE